MTQKERRKNNPLHKLIKLDKEDRHLLKEYSWSLNKDGYPRAKINKKVQMLHAIILPKKDGFDRDHINRNKLDNRRCNLRYITHQENGLNRSLSKNNTSGFKGIHWNKKDKKWRAVITVKRKSVYNKGFFNKEDAIIAYNKKFKELFPSL